MNESFFQVLQRARESQSLVAIYTNVDSPRAFLAGWVEAVTQEHVVMRHLSPEGRYDGYVLKYVDSIFRVDAEGRYIERLQFLYNARNQEFPARLINGDVADDASLIPEMLSAAQNEGMMVSIEVAADDMENGVVRDVGFDTVLLEVYDYFGSIDREATIHLEAISEVRVDSERLQSLKMLSNWHQLPGLE